MVVFWLARALIKDQSYTELLLHQWGNLSKFIHFKTEKYLIFDRVMDMLRYQLFTIGHSWVSEYGSSDDPIHFPNVFSYSPLHNIKFPEDSEHQYPAVLVTTSDHDDRVVPSHSYKYTAELQYKIGTNDKQVAYATHFLCSLVSNFFNSQTQPLLLRVETEAGHGAGSPISKLIEEQVDILSFLTESLDLAFEGKKAERNGVADIRYSITTIIVTVSFAFFLAFE